MNKTLGILGRTLGLLLLASLSILFAFGGSHAAEDPVFNPQLSIALQESLEKARETLGTDNVSASLYISDRCYWEGAAGVTTQDPEVQVSPDTIYGFGSITKTFVAGIILQLVDENRLNLDDPLGRWITPIRNIDPEITVRQLLNHGSGLSGYINSDRYWTAINADPNRVWLPEETLQYERRPRGVDADPQYYSNSNYILLGMIVEAISGNTLSKELENRITGPLQLDSTYLPVDEFKPDQWANNTRLSISRYSSTWGAGAIASTSRDIAKWTQTLHTGDFLEPATLEAMRITHPRRISGHEVPMGLGVWKLGRDKINAWGHGGQYRPFLSATYYIPDLGLSVAHSFIANSGEQTLPGKLLIDTYMENQPTDTSICFDHED